MESIPHAGHAEQEEQSYLHRAKLANVLQYLIHVHGDQCVQRPFRRLVLNTSMYEQHTPAFGERTFDNDGALYLDNLIKF